MSLLKKIKLSKKLGSFIVLVFVFFPNLIFAQSNQEKINSFDIEIEVFESGDIHVKETIVYDFGLNEKRGIYREIPFKKVPGGIRGIDIKNIKVTDNINNDYKYIIDSTSPLNIKIGDPNVYITGEHTYVIDYDVKNAIGSFENFDEIYWNTTGDEWEVPIIKATSKVILHKKIPTSDLQVSSYCGYKGSNATCSVSLDISQSNSKTVIDFGSSNPQQLSAFQGMTVAVGFPKGFVIPAKLSWWEKEITYVIASIVGALLSLCFFLIWLFRVYLPRYYSRKKPIIAEYTPPDKLTAGEASYVYNYINNRSSSELITADILYLASQGYVTIRKDEEKNHWWEKESFAFSLTGKILDENESSYLQDLLEEITFSDKEKTFEDIKKEKAYYTFLFIAGKLSKSADMKNDNDASASSDIFGAIKTIAFVGFMGVFLFTFLVISNISLTDVSFRVFAVIFGSLIFIAILLAIKKVLLTHLDGKTDLWYKVAGLREYINIAEKDRINFASDPEKATQLFSNLLPFAIAFKLEKKWVKMFDGILPQNPSWYQSQDNNFSSNSFSKSISAFAFGVSTTSSSGRPNSSGGGSGGGGFSGGGVGGGGGGSW